MAEKNINIIIIPGGDTLLGLLSEPYEAELVEAEKASQGRGVQGLAPAGVLFPIFFRCRKKMGGKEEGT
ncbi:MAG: hypothetical protein ABH860_05935 [bacterium]